MKFLSSHSNNGVPRIALANNPPPPIATTDEVISILLQRHMPVAPMAHGASKAPTPPLSEDPDNAPLDFSSASKKRDDNESDAEQDV